MPCPQGIDTDCFLCHREIYPSQMDRPHGACAKPVSDWARLPQSLPLRPSLSCLHWHTRHLHTLSYISCQAFHWPVLPALKTVSYHYFHLLHRCLLLTHVFHLLLSGRYYPACVPCLPRTFTQSSSTALSCVFSSFFI